jgi:hypothetical protein
LKFGNRRLVKRAWVLVIAGLALLMVGAGGASSAFAASEYQLDPVLSLTGACKPPPTPDTKEDPGCPEKHPPQAFKSPRSITTDAYGNIYVASYGSESANGKEGRVDLFDSKGDFITELPEPVGPKDIAVDSEGNLYVYNANPLVDGKVVRYEPTVYKPEEGKIEYGNPPVLVTSTVGGFLNSLAVTSDDHLFFKRGQRIEEFSSAAEGNKLLDDSIGFGTLSSPNGLGLAIDETRGLIYAGDNGLVRVFELASPHKLLQTVNGSETPAGKFTAEVSLAVDEETGNFFVFDLFGSNKVINQFREGGEDPGNGSYLKTLQFKFPPIIGSELHVDNGKASHFRYLFAPSENNGVGQSLAFQPPPPVLSPVIEAIAIGDVTQEDAELQATINPRGGDTEYIFEYTTQEAFDKEEFAGATLAGSGVIPAGQSGIRVSVAALGLSPETAYRFRVRAENECEEPDCSAEKEGSFTTYPAPETPLACSNDAVRTGLSALLPDCRAYELVTPPDTNARAPRGIGKTAGIYFTTREASPAGDKVSFITEGGTIPGNEGTGSLSGDAYLATRSADGWSTASAGPDGVEAEAPLTGSTSPDQGHSFWGTNGPGGASIEGKPTNYVRYPDGHSELIGQGSLGIDPDAEGRLISEGGGHIIFDSTVRLEAAAPPSGTKAIYDRTSDGITHVVSLLPDDVPLGAGQPATYLGASLDGEGVAFTVGSTLYLRHDNEETYEIGKGVTFAGIAEGGGRIFYVASGDLLAFDVEGEGITPFTTSGDATVVNVSSDGTAAYFVSPTALSVDPNPIGDIPQVGGENLYLSREGAVSFVGTVTKRDVEGEFGAGGEGDTEQAGGLGLWTKALEPTGGTSGRFAIDPSRSTPDGSVLIFESRANLTGYDPGVHAQIYRYDSVTGALQCLSCNPTQASPSGDSSLQSILQQLGGPEPLNSYAVVNNLRSDGRRAFFQSPEPLVLEDTDGLQDVYEWEAQGEGSCNRPAGCVYLISSGHSNRADYLYAVSDSGDDVFFRTSDRLLPSDPDSTPSIYDARVGGGFPESAEICELAQDCPGPITPPPFFNPPTSGAIGPSGNVPESKKPRRCAKGKHKVTRNGKTRCVKKHNKRKHRKAGSKKGAGK